MWARGEKAAGTQACEKVAPPLPLFFCSHTPLPRPGPTAARLDPTTLVAAAFLALPPGTNVTIAAASFTAASALVLPATPWPAADGEAERSLRAAASRAAGAAATAGGVPPPPALDVAASPDAGGRASLLVRLGGFSSAGAAAEAAGRLEANMVGALATELAASAPRFEDGPPGVTAHVTLVVEGAGVGGAGVEASVRAAVEKAAAAAASAGEAAVPTTTPPPPPPSPPPSSSTPRRAGPDSAPTPTPLAPTAIRGIGVPDTDTPAPTPAGPTFGIDPFRATSGVGGGVGGRGRRVLAVGVGLVAGVLVMG